MSGTDLQGTAPSSQSPRHWSSGTSSDNLQLTSTSDLLPMDAGDNILSDTSWKSSPQYIGRRLSNARRSAQISPEDVQSVFEHTLDLSLQPYPGDEGQYNNSSADQNGTGLQDDDLVTTSKAIPLDMPDSELALLRAEKLMLLQSLQAAEETISKQQLLLERSTVALKEAVANPAQPRGRDPAPDQESEDQNLKAVQRSHERLKEMEQAKAKQQEHIGALHEKLSRLEELQRLYDLQQHSSEAMSGMLADSRKEMEMLRLDKEADNRTIHVLRHDLQEQEVIKDKILEQQGREQDRTRETITLQERILFLTQENSLLRGTVISEQARGDSLARQCKSFEERLQGDQMGTKVVLSPNPAELSGVSNLDNERLAAHDALLRIEPQRAEPGRIIGRHDINHHDGLVIPAQLPIHQPGAQSSAHFNVLAVDQRPAGISSSAPPEGGIFGGSNSRRQSSTGSLSSRMPLKPFATETSLQEFMEKTKRLETQLMEDNRERELLEGELARVSGSGRTLLERHRRAAADTRLEFLRKEIGTIRMQLKQMGALKL